MISPATAALAVSVARGLIKFGQRLDALMAEKQAIQGGLALVMPEVYQGPDGVEKTLQLKAFLAESPNAADLLGGDHADLVRELKKDEPEAQFVGECYARVFPDRLAVAVLNPDAKLISDFCGRLAECVQERTLTGIDASAIASAAVETLLNNPALFDEARSNLATATLNAVIRVAGNDPAKLLVGGTLVNTVREVLAALARYGKTQVQTAPFDKAVDRLAEVLKDSLALVANELGRRLDLTGVPAVMGGLVAAWARGDFVKIEPEAPSFQELLGRLLASANTR